MTPLQDLLAVAKSRSASDVLVMVGDAPSMRVAGEWARFDHPRLTVEELEQTTRELLRPEAWEELQQQRELDFSCTFGKTGRVRCNAHYQRDHKPEMFELHSVPPAGEPAEKSLSTPQPRA